MSRATITFEELLALAEGDRGAPKAPSPSLLPAPIYSLGGSDLSELASWLPGFLLQGSFSGGKFLRSEGEVLGLIADFSRQNKCKAWTLTVHPSVLSTLPPSLRSRAAAASPASPPDHLWITWSDFAQGRWRPDTVR